MRRHRLVIAAAAVALGAALDNGLGLTPEMG